MFRNILPVALLLLVLGGATPAAHASDDGDKPFSVFGALLHRPVIFAKSIVTGADNGARAGAEAVSKSEIKESSQLTLPALGAACVGATIGAIVEPVYNTMTGKDPDHQDR